MVLVLLRLFCFCLDWIVVVVCFIVFSYLPFIAFGCLLLPVCWYFIVADVWWLWDVDFWPVLTVLCVCWLVIVVVCIVVFDYGAYVFTCLLFCLVVVLCCLGGDCCVWVFTCAFVLFGFVSELFVWLRYSLLRLFDVCLVVCLLCWLCWVLCGVCSCLFVMLIFGGLNACYAVCLLFDLLLYLVVFLILMYWFGWVLFIWIEAVDWFVCCIIVLLVYCIVYFVFGLFVDLLLVYLFACEFIGRFGFEWFGYLVLIYLVACFFGCVYLALWWSVLLWDWFVFVKYLLFCVWLICYFVFVWFGWIAVSWWLQMLICVLVGWLFVVVRVSLLVFYLCLVIACWFVVCLFVWFDVLLR